MRKILFDLTVTQAHYGFVKYNGGANYGIAILEKLVANKNIELSVVFFREKNLDERIEKIVKDNKIKTNKIEQLSEINKIIENENIEIFYTPIANTNFFINKTKAKYIGTIHDIWEYEIIDEVNKYKNYYYGEYIYIKDFIRKYLKKIFKRSMEIEYKNKYISVVNNLDKIITDSNYSKFAILREFGYRLKEKIEVLYPPLLKEENRDNSNNYNNVEVKFGIENKKFFLMVSANRILKNNYRAMKALDKFFDENKECDYKVVVTGVFNNNFKLKNIEKFIFLGYLDRFELTELYQKAFCFIYPTVIEGFGYPPLEAFKYSTFTISASSTCLTDIYGDSILYFNPYSEIEILTRIYQIYYDDVLKNEIRIKIEKKYNEILNIQNSDLEKIEKILIDM